MPDPQPGPDPQAPPPKPAAPAGPPTRIGGFEILEKVGTGGMGGVYKARQISLDRIVALKILPPHLEKDAEFMQRFVREARATGKLSHPNVVAGIDVGQADGYWYFAMEFVEGDSLGRILKKKGRLPEAQAVDIAIHVAEGLAHAHSHALVHRDVKPQNILIDREGVAKICDLGLARSTAGDSPALTQDGTAVGTPSYLSPEQARGEKTIDARSDIYSLGATLFHLTAGRPPFVGDSATIVMTMHLTEPAPDLAKVAEGVSAGLAAVVATCLEKDPANRYRSMGELAEALRRVRQGQAPAAAPAVPPAPAGSAAPTRATSSIVRAKTGMHSTSRPITIRAIARAQAARSGSPAAWIAIVLVLAALGGVLAFLALSGGTRPAERERPAPPRTVSPPVPPPPVAPPAPAAKEADPDRPPAADKRKETAAAAEARLAAAADALAAKGDFDGAIAAWQAIPPHLAGPLKPRAEQAAAELRGEAEARMKEAMDEADLRLAAGEPDEGLRALDAVKGVKYSAWDARVAALRARLAAAAGDAARVSRKKALDAALAAFAKYSDAFVAATTAGDAAAAKKAADDAKADPSLKEIAATVAALSDLSDAVQRAEDAFRKSLAALRGKGPRDFETRQGPIRGEVVNVTAVDLHLRCATIVGGMDTVYETTVRLADLGPAVFRRHSGDFKPSTPAEHLGQAARALAIRDIEKADAALAAAAGHPMAPPYRARLLDLRAKAAETAAREAWEAVARLAGTGKIAAQKSRQVLDRIAAFEKDYGRTAFAASAQAEIAALKERASAAGVAWKPIPAGGLPVRCQGTASSSAAGDALTVQVPAGPANMATVLLLPHVRDFRLRFEYRGELLEMFLRKVNWHGCINLLAGPAAVVARAYPTDLPNQPQVLAHDKQSVPAAGQWHRVEIAAIGSSFTFSIDGAAGGRDLALPAVARGDVQLLAWPGRSGGAFEIRKAESAVLDRQQGSGASEGIVTNKGPDWVEFQEDGEDVPLRYVPPAGPGGAFDPQVAQAINDTITPNRARLSWTLDRGTLRVTSLQVLKPPQPNGALVGTIAYKQGNCIEVRPAAGPPERFIPRWTGSATGQGGGPDPRIVNELTRYNVGDKVKVDWVYDDRKRLVGIEPAR